MRSVAHRSRSGGPARELGLQHRPRGAVPDEHDVLLAVRGDANILTNPLRMLAPAIAGRVRANGRIVLSGVLADQAPSVADAYAQWFNIGVWRTADGWAALSGSRR